MTKPHFYISEQQLNLIVGSGYWTIQDLPSERAEQIRPFFNNVDTIGVFASGIAPRTDDSKTENVAGIDWVRLESKPKSGEPPLNVYHFVIKKKDSIGYPVYACQNGTSIAPHWSDLKDLDVYCQNATFRASSDDK